MQETYAHKVYAGEVRGIPMSAIQATTASAVCAVLDLLAQGALASRGYVQQEEIALEAFEPVPWPVNLVYVGQGLLPLKLRAFLDFAVPRLKARLTEQTK